MFFFCYIFHLPLQVFCRLVPWCSLVQLFHGAGPYHTETSPLICSGNQLAGFYMIETSAMKGLSVIFRVNDHHFINCHCLRIIVII